MRIAADPERCAASGNCVRVAPNVFGQDTDGLVVVKVKVPHRTEQANAVTALDGCPTGAIWDDEE